MTDKDPLDPSLVLHTASKLVSRLESANDALALALHSIVLCVGFRFAGIGDDARQEGDGTRRELPTDWNQTGPHHYQFRYSHPQSSLTFVIKLVRMGDKSIVLGTGINDNKIAQVDFLTKDYTSDSFFPNDLSEDPLVHGFISTSRFHDFIKLIKLNIIQHLIPGLNKPGYEDSRPDVSRPDAPRQETQRNEAYRGDESNPLSVGRDDLHPFGNRLRLPGSGGIGSSGGMHVGPSHPMFGTGGYHDPFGSSGRENLPRGAVPPGARFDPIHPPGLRFNTRRPPGGGPDNDELFPPDYDHMFG
ncbi:PI31 proteasome regulator N-terminal-domain-containing protein [Sporodiniella umbellata]|nr:PI31 proteasome regulator N-terminal-domain-containing protein [Sporodiniella umbellata]